MNPLQLRVAAYRAVRDCYLRARRAGATQHRAQMLAFNAAAKAYGTANGAWELAARVQNDLEEAL